MLNTFVPRSVRRAMTLVAMSAALFVVLTPQSSQAAITGVVNGEFTADTNICHECSDVYTEIGTFGGITVLREDITFKYLGALTGLATDVNILYIFPDGSFVSFATEVCNNCTIAGRTGTFTANYFIVGESFDFYTGYLVFTGGTGGLAGLSGYGTFQHDPTPSNTYSYRYRLP